jgi:hypothetical protein
MSLAVDREVMELECQLRLIELAECHDPAETPLDLWSDAFWQGVRACAKPRSLEALQGQIAMRRARALGLTKG